MAKTKQKKGKSAGAIAGIVVAALLIVALFGGIIFYVHSGGAGRGESAGIITANETTEVSQTTTVTEPEETTAAETTAETAADKTTAKKAGTADKAATTKNASSVKVEFKSSVTAKQMGKYFAASPEDTYKAYDGKTVTLSGTLSDKSAKMLYVELKTGTDTPCRVYLNSEEQREQFYNMGIGTSIKVKGEMAIILPAEMDQGGFQEMANGLIGINDVTVVK